MLYLMKLNYGFYLVSLCMCIHVCGWCTHDPRRMHLHMSAHTCGGQRTTWVLFPICPVSEVRSLPDLVRSPSGLSRRDHLLTFPVLDSQVPDAVLSSFHEVQSQGLMPMWIIESSSQDTIALFRDGTLVSPDLSSFKPHFCFFSLFWLWEVNLRPWVSR